MDSLKIILDKYPKRQEYLLNILHEVQASHPTHCLEMEDLVQVAKHLGISKSSVYGVAQYYSMLSTSPQGNHQIHVCCSPVCSNAGSAKLLDELQRHFQHNDAISVNHCECLGHCDAPPSVQFDQQYLPGGDAKKLLKAIKELIKKNQHA